MIGEDVFAPQKKRGEDVFVMDSGPTNGMTVISSITLAPDAFVSLIHLSTRVPPSRQTETNLFLPTSLDGAK